MVIDDRFAWDTWMCAFCRCHLEHLDVLSVTPPGSLFGPIKSGCLTGLTARGAQLCRSKEARSPLDQTRALRGVVGELRLVSSSCLSPGGDRRAARQAVPSQRVRELASAKQRGALFRASDDPGDPRGRHDRRVVSASALLAKPSPRLQELALPLARKCRRSDSTDGARTGCSAP
ncbi:hypothetical protein CRUP_013592 [Coryphaenoides rupestris]|nr:hypothetical protein CRUP_013592 [Coryphaenoides rupestris]